MTLETLGWALRACAAYRHIVEEPLMGRVLALVDRLAAGDGAGAAEHYAGLFYALRAEGYAYAIIGGVGPVAFYEKCVGAQVIPGSTPGVYKDFLAAIEHGAMGATGD